MKFLLGYMAGIFIAATVAATIWTNELWVAFGVVATIILAAVANIGVE